MRRFLLPALLPLLLLAWLTGLALAANPFEKLLMPGPVVKSHADVELKCEACHSSFDKSAQDSLCLDCHKPIAADIKTKQGFHGRSALLKGAKCNLCHDDHKGRHADIVRLDPPTFDHRSTDFQLTGAHAFVACQSCHEPGKKFSAAPATCFACHDKDQPHRGNLGKACADCHSTTTWFKTTPFDHAKTKFPLTAKHRDVACVSCHLGEVYKDVKTSCNDCHAIQDPHGQRFGIACQTCHSETGWKPAKFDHAANTAFPLKGAHAKAECKACHADQPLRPVAATCAACHGAQDVHKGELGTKCESCHTDVSWRENVRFDHGLSKFPLTGLHAAVTCEACHASPAFQVAKTDCFACHADDDTHRGRLTPKCESCHATTGWLRVSFEHKADTKFPLTGKHARIGCYDCHTKKNVTDASLPLSCNSCHAKQDVHRGKFGTNCAQCHSTDAFLPAFIRKKP